MSAYLGGRVAIVTGANHGIGAATATLLAARGASVLATYLRLDDPEQPGTPATYAEHRARTADAVTAHVRAAGGTVVAIEADLADPATPGRLFDAARRSSGRSTSSSTTRVRGGRTVSSMRPIQWAGGRSW